MAIENSNSIKKIVLPFAILFGIGRIILDLIPKLAQANSKIYYSTFMIAFIIEAIAIVYLIKKYKKSQDNQLELSEALVIGVMFMLIVGGLYALQSYFYDTYIDSDFQKNTALEWASHYDKSMDVEKMIDQGDSIQQTSSIFSIFSSLLKFSILGILISFIAGTILRNR